MAESGSDSCFITSLAWPKLHLESCVPTSSLQSASKLGGHQTHRSLKFYISMVSFDYFKLQGRPRLQHDC